MDATGRPTGSCFARQTRSLGSRCSDHWERPPLIDPNSSVLGPIGPLDTAMMFRPVEPLIGLNPAELSPNQPVYEDRAKTWMVQICREAQAAAKSVTLAMTASFCVRGFCHRRFGTWRWRLGYAATPGARGAT